jgi:flavin-dependent dehydrogenase
MLSVKHTSLKRSCPWPQLSLSKQARGEPGNCDVLVIGGGPAGSTIASILAQRGREVVLLEKDRHPRFHIGESLLPLNLPLFDRLGVASEVQSIGVYKPGAELVSAAHRKTATFRFADNPRLGIKHSYHVRRAEFDKLLLDNCRRLGVTVFEEMRVSDVELSADDRAQVIATGPGANSQWFPRFVVDATGRDTLLSRRLGLRLADKRNNTAALFGHFRGMRRPQAEGMITVHLLPHGWMWLIPLPNDVMSVGFVGTQSFFKMKGNDADGFFAHTIASSCGVSELMANAEPVGPLMAAANYSYISRRAAGRGYILVGDAFGFIDPLFSSGVMLAMSSAALGAEAVDLWLDDPKLGERQLRDYERKVRRSITALSWMIHRINRPVFRDILMSSADFLGTRNGLLTILGGDFYGASAPLSPIRRLQLGYGTLLFLSKLGIRLGALGSYVTKSAA